MKPLRVAEAGTVPYGMAYEWQKILHERRVRDEIADVLLLLQHPHVYTLGRRFSKEHLLVDEKVLAERGIEVVEADRGGSITYHGPGQLVGYPIMNLAGSAPAHPSAPNPDAIRYLRMLEEVLIRAVRTFGVVATRREGRTGVWVGKGKLGAIGVNVSRGVTKHGFALNVTTDLSYFQGMVPCGIPDAAATSLEEILKEEIPMREVIEQVVEGFGRVFRRYPVFGALEILDLPGAEAPSARVIPFPEKGVG